MLIEDIPADALSLRSYFAIRILEGYIASCVSTDATPLDHVHNLVERCYILADEMMKFELGEK